CCSSAPFCRSEMKCSRFSSASSMVANNSSRTRLSDVGPAMVCCASRAVFQYDLSVGKIRLLLGHVCAHGDTQIGRLQHRGIPGGDVLQAVIDPVIAHVTDHLFGAAN